VTNICVSNPFDFIETKSEWKVCADVYSARRFLDCVY